MTECISVYITAPTKGEAEKIARALVEERLAACVNIISDVRSIFHWKGKVEAAHEFALIAKTHAALFTPLEKRVKELHTHECPCIVAWAIAAGYEPYLDWIAEETKAG
jgi:periplasmic divalent cation tolerance protein